MIDHYLNLFFQWHESLKPTARVMFDFFVGIILIRGILARKITTALEQLGNKIAGLLKKRLVKTERDMAIWVHYHNQAMNRGHHQDTPIDCEEDRCNIV
jgi:hypothetical protein